MGKSVLITGANGRLGRMLSRAFVGAGWEVKAQVRRDPGAASQTGVRWIRASLGDPAALAGEVGAAEVVIHAANPPYPRWRRQALPLTRAAIETARRLNALLMFPGNVYNFGALMPRTLVETTPQQPTTRKGRIRVEIENAMREAARAGLRCVIVRAGDFFGGPGRGSWFDRVIVRPLPRGEVVYPGRVELAHAWAYLPDLARTFVMVAERRSALAVFDTLHFPGHAPTGEELLACIAVSARRLGLLGAGRELQRRSLPWGWLRAGGLLIPLWRELAELRYLWEVPHRLSGERLAKVIGAVPATPLDEAMDATLRELFIAPRPG
jgi:nucleoside-diphosphate-sugar epimerase